jgi:hypothetical protein
LFNDIAKSWCINCSRRRLLDEFRCPACGCEHYDDQLYGPGGEEPVNDPKTAKLGGILGRIVTLNAGEVLVLLGPKGAGKTSLALSGFQEILEPWVMTSEMSPRKLRRYAKRLGIKLGGISEPGQVPRVSRLLAPSSSGDPFDRPLELPEHQAAREAETELGLSFPRDGRFMGYIVDSLTMTGDPVRALALLMDRCQATGARAIATSQWTTAGTARGGSMIEYNADVTVEIEKISATERRAVCTKSRNEEEKSILFQYQEDGNVGGLAWDPVYYSIEGTDPDYTIVPWPSPGAHPPRHAGLLRALASGERLEDLELPPPPVAVAALDGGNLYPGRSRWVEPRDARHRAAFANAHGLNYYRAVDDTLIGDH